MPRPFQQALTDAQRAAFDQLLEAELARLPAPIYERLEEVPVIVEDEPSPALLAELGMDRRGGDLCGLHAGVPLTQRSVEHSGRLPDQIMIFRGPVLRLAGGRGRGRRRGSHDELQRQIRITLLHEIGHHFGLDETDLEELGYG